VILYRPARRLTEKMSKFGELQANTGFSWQRILKWEHLGLIVLLALTLILHFLAINRPPTIVWDEVWYVGDARSIISGTGELRPEHPPLAKLLIAAGDYLFNGFKAPVKATDSTSRQWIGSSETDDITLAISDTSPFKIGDTIRIEDEQMDITSIDASNHQITVKRGAGGSTISSHNESQVIFVFYDNGWGWRFFAIFFGEAGIIVFYLICRRLNFSRTTTNLATFLFALENMTFLHAGLALLDIYMLTFMLAAVYFYLDEWYFMSGIMLALSGECKMTSLLIILALLVHWLIYRRSKLPQLIVGLASAAVCYVVVLVLCDYLIVHSFENPVARIHTLLSSTGANQFTVPKLSISSRPWTWIYPQWVQVYDNSPNVPFIIYSFDPQYVSFISSTIQILIIPAVGYLIYKMAKGNQAAGLAVLWFAFTYVLWIPLDIISNRVAFVFYFLPTTPAICLGLAMAIKDILARLRRRREETGRLTAGVKAAYAGIGFYLMLHLAIFIVFNPAIPPIIKTWLPPFSGS
jgi:dolichyl-phosphate-mannose--protein O-mannosyl transferase